MSELNLIPIIWGGAINYTPGYGKIVNTTLFTSVKILFLSGQLKIEIRYF